jgi:hypothetical protein
MGIVSKKLRDSARGQPCTVRSPWCEYVSETTVLAHLPSQVKGMGNKGDDWHAVFSCASCHAAMDQRKPGAEWARLQIDAIQRTQRRWFEMGLMTFPVTEHRARQSEKILARPAHFRR